MDKILQDLILIFKEPLAFDDPNLMTLVPPNTLLLLSYDIVLGKFITEEVMSVLSDEVLNVISSVEIVMSEDSLDELDSLLEFELEISLLISSLESFELDSSLEELVESIIDSLLVTSLDELLDELDALEVLDDGLSSEELIFPLLDGFEKEQEQIVNKVTRLKNVIRFLIFTPLCLHH